MPSHTVKQGECLSSIAKEYGVAWKTIWEHANNKALRDLRKSPNVLYVGDQVFVPDLTQKQVSVAPKQTHTFKVKAPVSKLRLQVLAGGAPVKDATYTLSIDGVEVEPKKAKKTDGKGMVIADIAPGAGSATVEVAAQKTRYELDLGHLDPAVIYSGITERLRQLGYYPAAAAVEVGEEDKDLLHVAVWLFQNNKGLTATGEVDSATIEALEKAYGT